MSNPHADPAQTDHELAQASENWTRVPSAMEMLRVSVQIVQKAPLAFLALILIAAAASLLDDWLTQNYLLIPENHPLFPISFLIEPSYWLSIITSCTIFILTVRTTLSVYFSGDKISNADRKISPRYFRAILPLLVLYVSLQLCIGSLLFLPAMAMALMFVVISPFMFYALFKLTFWGYIAIFEQTGYLQSATLSWNRLTGYTWTVFRFTCLLCLPLLMLLPFHPTIFEPSTPPLAGDYLACLAAGIMEVFGTLGALWLYFEQRFGRIPNHSVPFHAPLDAEPAA